MSFKRAPYPPEFRRQLIELVRSGRTPEELSLYFGPQYHTRDVDRVYRVR